MELMSTSPGSGSAARKWESCDLNPALFFFKKYVSWDIDSNFGLSVLLTGHLGCLNISSYEKSNKPWISVSLKIKERLRS